jgi:hypothetical protein
MQAVNTAAGIKQAPDTTSMDMAAKTRESRQAQLMNYFQDQEAQKAKIQAAKEQKISDYQNSLAKQKDQQTYQAGQSAENRELRKEIAASANQLKSDMFNTQMSQRKEEEERRTKGLKQSLGKQIRTEQIDILLPKLDNIEATINKYQGKDLPGAGYFDSAVAKMSGNRAGPEEGQKLRQETASVANILLKSRSGAAVTNPEYRRFLEEAGTGAIMSEERFKQGIRMMRQDMENIKNTVRNGTDPEMYDEVMSKGRPAPVGGNTAPKSYDDMTEEELDAELAKRK